MLSDTQQYFNDVLELVPLEGSTLLIQSPDIEVSVLEKLNYKGRGVCNAIELNKANREVLISEIIYNGIEVYMQSLEIIVKGKLFFEGYDGMDYGTFSKDVQLPPEFIDAYIKGEMGVISEEW